MALKVINMAGIAPASSEPRPDMAPIELPLGSRNGFATSIAVSTKKGSSI